MKASQVTLDLHACGSHYLDLATQSQVVEATGGALHHYKHIDASSAAGESAQPGSRAHTRAALQRRLLEDRVAGISDQGIVFEPIVKVRASAGLRVGNVFGHVFDNSGTEAYCAGMDARSSFAFDLVRRLSATPPLCHMTCFGFGLTPHIRYLLGGGWKQVEWVVR